MSCIYNYKAVASKTKNKKKKKKNKILQSYISTQANSTSKCSKKKDKCQTISLMIMEVPDTSQQTIDNRQTSSGMEAAHIENASCENMVY